MRLINKLAGDVHLDQVSIPASGAVFVDEITPAIQEAIDRGHIEIIPEAVVAPVVVKKVKAKTKAKAKPKPKAKTVAVVKKIKPVAVKSLEPIKATEDTASTFVKKPSVRASRKPTAKISKKK